jgi:alpha,alpha-trehalase
VRLVRSSSNLRALIRVALAIALIAPWSAAAEDGPRPPSAIYGELFERVQRERVFDDSKTFPDAIPNQPPATILADYRAAVARPDFDLRKFVASRFSLPERAQSTPEKAPAPSVEAYIDEAWSELIRTPAPAPEGSSLVTLPHQYVVPGGRFSEIYYWDSYFTMRGLERSGRHDVVRAMLDNFAWLVERFGHIPNGNRSYYLSRSQPPFLAFMVDLLAERDGEAVYARYLGALQREYAFWMSGAELLRSGEAHRRVVRLPDGSVLNRYWDDLDTPRDEAYREDVETARASGRPVNDVYRSLRAAAESGWDFSSRWLGDGLTLPTIRTIDLIPPDLNSLLYKLELTIARGCEDARDVDCVQLMRARADARKSAMTRHLWNVKLGAFVDYDWRAARQARTLTAATLYPLYVNASSAAQARAIVEAVRAHLLERGGLATTEASTGQQWDRPNGWAPLQWIAVQGLRNYGASALAALIAQRWVRTNLGSYAKTGQLFEKYDVENPGAGGGGEYSTQVGFGWTNAVLKELLAMYPSLRRTQNAPRKPPARRGPDAVLPSP